MTYNCTYDTYAYDRYVWMYITYMKEYLENFLFKKVFL